MRISTRLPTLAVIAAAAVMAVAACGNEPGNANPGPTTEPTSVSSPAEQTTEQPSSELASVKACELLTEADAQRVGPSVGDPDEDGAAAGVSSSCTWQRSVSHSLGPLVFGIDLRPSQTVDEVLASSEAKVTSGKVGEREAKQVAEDGGIVGGCMLSFAVGTGRVDIIVESEKTDVSCKAASDISTIIEPKLPKA